MDCDTQATTELIYTENKAAIVRNSEYKLDLWRELCRRWMVVGVLLVMTLAVLAPKVGAPGGPLYTHYISYLPLWYIYYSCGSRSPPRAAPARLHALVCVHAHVVTPALAVVVVSALRDVTDYRIVKGALFAAVGGPCLWLSAALSPHALTAPLVFGSGLAAAFAAPLCTLLLCGRLIVPALSATVTSVVSVAVPYAAGVLFPSRQEPAASRLCALLLLYVEACDTLTHAEGMLYMSDVLVIVLLELTQLVTSAAWCWAWSRSAAVGAEWRLLALCAVPKGQPEAAAGVACGVWGLASVPTAVVGPLRVAVLAALAPDE